MKRDILSRKDIKLIITEFYKKLISDAEMLPFFEEIIKMNHLENHIEIITDFWQDILMDSRIYKSNILQKHLDFNKKMRFRKQHFKKWLQYLKTTIDSLFEGQISENMKNRASSIAMVMEVKMNLYN